MEKLLADLKAMKALAKAKLTAVAVAVSAAIDQAIAFWAEQQSHVAFAIEALTK